MKKPFMIMVLIFSLTGAAVPGSVETQSGIKMKFTEELALKFSEMALNCIEKEYPNKPGHVFSDASDAQTPRQLHPAFYGCFDWHSSVHGHWMLVKVLKTFPGISHSEKIRAALKRNITGPNISAEKEYFYHPENKSFERMYGWSWLLKLAAELATWDDPDGRSLFETLSPLAEKIEKSYMDFLPKQTYPIRTGVHPNTAFGMLFALDYAKALNRTELADLIEKRSMDYYAPDRSCPSGWEPGGEDFFSPCLMEALLMSRVLPAEKFRLWFGQFLPDLGNSTLLIPAVVSDRSDGKLSHLDGLNLSRVWGFAAILKIIDGDDSLREKIRTAAELHMKTAMENIRSGFYEGEHWLGSFAVYAYSGL